MEYNTIRQFRLKNKDVVFFLKDGYHISHENLIDVMVIEDPNVSQSDKHIPQPLPAAEHSSTECESPNQTCRQPFRCTMIR